jgi:hypothetical protein
MAILTRDQAQAQRDEREVARLQAKLSNKSLVETARLAVRKGREAQAAKAAELRAQNDGAPVGALVAVRLGADRGWGDVRAKPRRVGLVDGAGALGAVEILHGYDAEGKPDVGLHFPKDDRACAQAALRDQLGRKQAVGPSEEVGIMRVTRNDEAGFELELVKVIAGDVGALQRNVVDQETALAWEQAGALRSDIAGPVLGLRMLGTVGG